MKWFKSNNSDLEKLLTASRQDFRFDSNEVKQRLMMSVQVRHLTREEKQFLIYKPSSWPNYAVGLATAFILAVTTTGLAYASSQSKPGDILFPVQKLQNQIILSLPLPQTKKAEISTNIATKRLKELDEITKDPQAKPEIVTAEVNAVDDSIQQAAKLTPETDSQGSTKHPEHINNILDKLDDLTTQQQQTLQTLDTQVQDQELKKKIQTSLSELQLTKEKLKERHSHHSESEDNDSN